MSDGDAQRPADTSIADTQSTAVGDGRKKHVSIRTRTNDRYDHGDVYLKHSSTAFFISSEPSFPEETTTRYAKDNLSRVEVIQHHSMCFITTAAAGDGPALDALREFRDEVLVRSELGRALVVTYDSVSPPIAATLSRHPEARTTRVVRWLVGRCGALARRRTHVSSAARTPLTGLLVVLYVLGVACAALGHLTIRLRESLGEKSSEALGG